MDAGAHDSGATPSADARDAATVDAGAQSGPGAQDAAVSDAGYVGGMQDAAAASGDDSGAGATARCPGAVNACGGCEVLPAAPGSACGACGLGVNACSGSDAVTCTGGSSMPTTPSGTWLLDDFEDSSRYFSAGLIRGVWFLISDGTVGVLNPSTDDGLVPTSPGAAGSSGALHVSGSGFSDWGGGIQGSLNLEDCYVNAAAQKGVSFQARGTGTVLFALATKQTVPVADGGSCASACYDNFEAAITLTNTWKPYQIPWSMLHQAGWGTPTTFQPSQLKYMQLSFRAGASMDLYLDDVSLY